MKANKGRGWHGCDHNTPYSDRLTSHQYFKKVRCEEQIVHTMPARNLRNQNSYLSLHNYTYQLQRWSINDTVAMQNSQTSKESMDESGLNVTIFLTHATLWSGINGCRCSNQGKTRHAWKTKRALLSLVLLTYLGQGRYFSFIQECPHRNVVLTLQQFYQLFVIAVW